jgi:acyl transferase domain-containing protein
MLEIGPKEDEIAIIGMAGRFPGARNLDQFWDNLVNRVESITFFAEDELRATGVDDDDLNDPNYVRAAPVLEDMEMFDAPFFGFTPKEADIRDPQHRLFLECAYEAFQHAGYDPRRYPGEVGVFGGVFTNRYAWQNVRKNIPVLMSVGGIAMEIANHADYVATLVAYKLNLRGPALTVATACSTSMVALHLACQSLRAGECEMALAGAVEIELPHRAGYTYAEGGIFSPDGHCRAFDARAQGTIFGSGAGVVLIKRLEDALADGDRIHAVIKGSAINNDGAQKVGFTAPSVEGQRRVVAEAYGVAGVDPTTVTYVEAHGTGTALGDPIEVTALSEVFTAGTETRQWCALGTVKTNIGHLGPAAGSAGLIKTVLALEHELIPPILHFEKPNPKIDFPSTPFFVATEPVPWPADGTRRRAGVSSFGIGGTNAHVVIEEAPPVPPSVAARPWQLLTLSARTETAVEATAAELARHLREHPELPLSDVAYTLQVGREGMRQRRTVVCRSPEEAVTALETAGSRAVATGVQEPRARPVAFMFPGQGTQHPGMGRGL